MSIPYGVFELPYIYRYPAVVYNIGLSTVNPEYLSKLGYTIKNFVRGNQ